ncbi:hypothetical protein BD311DRAFT_32449 [Dichomitus squalens]|uniref:Uncharacterized protein n=1 Tax=Dichomitus squalens TaxID=114155 RepID=A0A4Q9MWK9_9APHY|nr:hypothetical protein BD311DRAFT_32449 [Dichomitus squalens]
MFPHLRLTLTLGSMTSQSGVRPDARPMLPSPTTSCSNRAVVARFSHCILPGPPSDVLTYRGSSSHTAACASHRHLIITTAQSIRRPKLSRSRPSGPSSSASTSHLARYLLKSPRTMSSTRIPLLFVRQNEYERIPF